MASLWDRLQLRKQEGNDFIGSGRWRAVRFVPREQEELLRRRMRLADDKYQRDINEALGEGFVKGLGEALVEERSLQNPVGRIERR